MAHHDPHPEEPVALHAKVLTVSDGVHHGTREDASGEALAGRLTEAGWTVVERAVCEDREAPGLAEAMRLVSPFGRLSRAVAGTRGSSLILNTPGSTKGCIETLEAVLDVLPHAVRLMVDNRDPHPIAGADPE
jgi:molybdopterin adenylyltransferase